MTLMKRKRQRNNIWGQFSWCLSIKNCLRFYFKIADKMADKTYKKNKIKETTDPNLNELEINDNSTIEKIIIITRIDCKQG